MNRNKQLAAIERQEKIQRERQLRAFSSDLDSKCIALEQKIEDSLVNSTVLEKQVEELMGANKKLVDLVVESMSYMQRKVSSNSTQTKLKALRRKHGVI